MKTRAIPTLISALFVLSFSSCAIDFDPGEWTKSEDLSGVSESSSLNSQEAKGEMRFILNENGESYSVAAGLSGSKGDIVVPSTHNGLPVTSVKKEGFRLTKIESITLPDSIVEIEESAFAECYDLVEVSLGKGVMTIGDSAFSDSRDIEEIIIPDNTITIGNYAFASCWASFPTLGKNVKYIGDGAFYDCRDIVNAAILPEGLTYLGSWAFAFTRIRMAYIPTSVPYIGIGAFSDNYLLEHISVDTENENYASIDGILYDKAQNEVLCFPSAKSPVSIREGVSDIGDASYYKCSYSGENLTIPESVIRIGELAFAGNYDLKTLTLGSNVVTMGAEAFSECNNLEEVTLNEGLKAIPDSCFTECGQLRSVSLPSSVESIGGLAFQDDQHLGSLRIKRGLKSIGNNAFYRCDELTAIDYEGTKYEWRQISKTADWKNGSRLKTIHCSDGDETV